MKNQSFFAACNSTEGFCSFFDELFFTDKYKKRLILKGGPGSGKSTFMKMIAKKAEDSGYTVTRYYCSSDADSLDGVCVEEPGFCVIDGTPPHSCDGKYIGCTDNLADLGVFRDNSKLTIHAEKIRELADKSKKAYAEAYKLLSCAGILYRAVQGLADERTDCRKLAKTAERYCSRLGTDKDPTLEYRTVSALTGDGIRTLCENFSDVKNVYYLAGSRFLSSQLIKLISERAECDRTVFRDPLLLHIPEALLAGDTLFTNNIAMCARKNVHTLQCGNFSKHKKTNLECFESRCADMIVNNAEALLKTAKEAHAELEKIYYGAMDFSSKEAYCEKLCDSLFGA